MCFMDSEVILQALYYIGKKIDRPVDKITALKIIYFADRYHLRKYARMITDDKYYAMEFGPVASFTKDVLVQNDFTCSEKDKEYIKSFIKINKDQYTPVPKELDLDMLSESDTEALDFAIEKIFKSYCKENKWKMKDLTHQYPEWKKFEKTIESGDAKREDMDIRDFFDNPVDLEDDPFQVIPDKLVKLSKELFLEC